MPPLVRFAAQAPALLPSREGGGDGVAQGGQHCGGENQMLAQAAWFGFRIGEISCPTKYFPEASSINSHRSVEYGLGVLRTSVSYRMQRMGLIHSPLFDDGTSERLEGSPALQGNTGILA